MLLLLYFFTIEFEGLLNIYSVCGLLFCKLEHYSKFIQYFIAFVISLKQMLQHYNNQYINELLFIVLGLLKCSDLMTKKVKTLIVLVFFNFINIL